MNAVKIKFNNKRDIDFVAELKESVYKYFEDKNLSTHANAAMVIKTIVMLSLYFVPFAFILSNLLNEWQIYLMYVIMGLGATGIGCSIQHDANHGAYSKNDFVNKLLGYSLNFIGGNDYMWKIKHNILHHTYTNIHGKDEDISVTKFLRLSPNAPHKPIHRIQHWLAWIAYSSLTFFWVFYFDFPKLKRYNGHGSPNPEMKHPLNEVITLFSFKILYYFTMIALPILLVDLPWWKVMLGFTLMHLVAGFTLTIIFQLAHIVENTDHPFPDECGYLDSAWFVHQMATTSNFATGNKLITWYVGGLNYQIEHHLFPKICSIHYPEISKIVIEKSKKFNISYNNQPSLRGAIVSHYSTLKKYSKPNEHIL